MRAATAALLTVLALGHLGAAPADASARSSKPRLSVVKVRVAPATLVPGGPLTVRATVLNSSRKRARRSRVSWYLVAGSARTRLGVSAVRALPSRRRKVVRTTLRVPPKTIAGGYGVVACDGGRCRRARVPLKVVAPAVQIAQPAEGSTTSDQWPAFSGTAGTAAGYGPVRLQVHPGTGTARPAIQTLTAAVGPHGRWSTAASGVLPLGRYTLVATQSDSAGNVGSAQRAFLTPAVLLAAGDIASCTQTGDSQTGALLAATPGDKVAVLGDDAYESGTAAEFANCYDPVWGFAKPRTAPAAGNHEYKTPGASGYFGYFGAAAGNPAQGWYSYDLGSWHVVVLNTSDRCVTIACSAGSPQDTWLAADLAAHRNRCTLAYWHHPLFSSDSASGAGPSPVVKPLWDTLEAGGADVVLNGHSHIYERFNPQDGNGSPTPGGMREFIVGTGGYAEHGLSATPAANSVVRNNNTFGIMRLVLRPGDYTWQFLPVAGKTFTDAGTASCH